MMSFTRVSNTENSAVSCNSDSGVGEIMLFGVRVVVDSMRKSVSLNNLSQYVHPENDKKNKSNNSNSNTVNAKNDVVADYASENDVAHNSCGNRERERKRGIPWTEEEHKLFLIGLQKVGKGDWRGISRNFVKTRTPTQVASHAQKYFLRRNNLNRRRRRSSLFDITTDSVLAIPMEEVHYQDNANHSHSLPPPPPEPCNASEFPLMPTYPLAVCPAVANVWIEKPIENLQRTLDYNAPTKLGHPTTHHLTLHSKIMADLNLNLSPKVDPTSLSLKLSLPIDTRESMERQAAFQAMSSFNNGESSITVA